jgi:hypothetical protein
MHLELPFSWRKFHGKNIILDLEKLFSMLKQHHRSSLVEWGLVQDLFMLGRKAVRPSFAELCSTRKVATVSRGKWLSFPAIIFFLFWFMERLELQFLPSEL